MPKSAITIAILFSLSLFVFLTEARLNPAAPQASGSNRSRGIRQIIPGHYVYQETEDSSSSFNSGIIVTSEGVVVVDALNTEAVARRVREAISGVTTQPVRFLISSTFHNNYTRGNVAYQDAVRIGHESYRSDLIPEMVRGESPPPEVQKARMPHQTYRDRMTIHLGGKEIQILHLGRAHTRGDSIVFVPEDRIAYLSEVFFLDQFPYTRTAYPSEWLQVLEKVEALDADILVPGHGFLPDDPQEARQGLRRMRQILVDVRDAVRREIARGATEDQAVTAIKLPQYEGLPGWDPAGEMALRRFYQELTGSLD